jgi:RNA polymerase sigma-70 factor (ECF subfamily)
MRASPAPVLRALDDADLVGRVVAGDPVAFEVIIRRHNRLLFRTIRGMVGNDADAEDALQDAWLSAHRALPGFRKEARLSTWLLRIAINAALMRRRKDSRGAVVVALRANDGGPDATDVINDVVDGHDTPEEASLHRELRQRVEREIDGLPEDFRVVFILRSLEERSVEETAAVLGIAEATVRSRHFRARSLLKDALDRGVDAAIDGAFSFDGDRCDRVVAAVFAGLDVS